jgi:hypothetical protein
LQLVLKVQLLNYLKGKKNVLSKKHLFLDFANKLSNKNKKVFCLKAGRAGVIPVFRFLVSLWSN